MFRVMRPLLAIVLASTLSGAALAADTPAPAAQQFIYVVRLAPTLHQQANWTDKHRAAVSEHFARLKRATEAGQVILAGRTTEDFDKTFGIVVFEAENMAAARTFMEEDPAIKAGVMTATVHPYAVALLRKQSPAN